MTPEVTAQYRLPRQFLLPILPSPRHLQADEILADADGEPVFDEKQYLLSCSLPEATLRSSYPSLYKYLEVGIERRIDERYLCRHRDPWYSQEDRPASPFLCRYMGRSGTRSGKPFRFILNHSKATAANVYLLLYPKPRLAQLLATNIELFQPVWKALSTITPHAMLGERRVYGGGIAQA